MLDHLPGHSVLCSQSAGPLTYTLCVKNSENIPLMYTKWKYLVECWAALSNNGVVDIMGERQSKGKLELSPELFTSVKHAYYTTVNYMDGGQSYRTF